MFNSLWFFALQNVDLIVQIVRKTKINSESGKIVFYLRMKRNSIPTLESSTEFFSSSKNNPKNVQNGAKLITLLSSATMFDSEFDLGILTTVLPKKELVEEKSTEWDFEIIISQIIADTARESRKQFLLENPENQKNWAKLDKMHLNWP